MLNSKRHPKLVENAMNKQEKKKVPENQGEFTKYMMNHQFMQETMPKKCNEGMGLSSLEMNIDNSIVNLLNLKSANIGVFTKPFVRLADLCMIKGEPDSTSIFLDNLSRSVYIANRQVTETVVNNTFRPLVLQSMNDVYGNIVNEFESIKPEQEEILRSTASVVLNNICYSFHDFVDHTNIMEVMETVYGPDFRNHIKSEDQFIDMTKSSCAASVSLFALNATALFIDNIYDALYKIMLFEMSAEDYQIVADALSPIFIDFRNSIFCYAAELTLILLLSRVASSKPFNDSIENLFPSEK